MIELPDDCLLHVLSYIEEISELHCIASTCSTLSRGKPKDFIKNKFLQKIDFIEYNFNKSIIWLVGGLPQMVFYPILSIDFMTEFRRVLQFPVKILPKHMKYPIMIGTHEGKAFVSFLIKHTIKDSIKGLVNKCSIQQLTIRLLLYTKNMIILNHPGIALVIYLEMKKMAL